MPKPHTLTPERSEKFLEKLRQCGGFVQVALALSRIKHSTFYDWCERGERGEEPFATFLADAMEIRALAATDQLKNHRRIGEGNGPQAVMASSALLGWLMPGQFGQKAQIAAAIKEGIQEALESARPHMKPESWSDFINAMAIAAGHGRVVGEADQGGDEAVATPQLLPEGTDPETV